MYINDILKIFGFLTLSPLSAFATYLCYKIYSTSLTKSAFYDPQSPLTADADIIYGWSLNE